MHFEQKAVKPNNEIIMRHLLFDYFVLLLYTNKIVAAVVWEHFAHVSAWKHVAHMGARLNPCVNHTHSLLHIKLRSFPEAYSRSL